MITHQITVLDQTKAPGTIRSRGFSFFTLWPNYFWPFLSSLLQPIRIAVKNLASHEDHLAFYRYPKSAPLTRLQDGPT